MEKQTYLAAIKLAHSKMKEFRKKEEEVFIKEYVFPYPQVITLQDRIFEALKVRVYLHYILDLFEIKIILDEETVALNLIDPVPVLDLLEVHQILPSPNEFSDILPLRGMEFAECMGCDGY
jgi:hypothetical protein